MIHSDNVSRITEGEFQLEIGDEVSGQHFLIESKAPFKKFGMEVEEDYDDERGQLYPYGGVRLPQKLGTWVTISVYFPSEDALPSGVIYTVKDLNKVDRDGNPKESSDE